MDTWDSKVGSPGTIAKNNYLEKTKGESSTSHSTKTETIKC